MRETRQSGSVQGPRATAVPTPTLPSTAISFSLLLPPNCSCPMVDGAASDMRPWDLCGRSHR